jgi:hypothetical protein
MKIGWWEVESLPGKASSFILHPLFSREFDRSYATAMRMKIG